MPSMPTEPPSLSSPAFKSTEPTRVPADTGNPLPRGLFAMDPDAVDLVYAEEDRRRIREIADLSPDLVLTPSNWRDHRDALRDCEFIFSGWKSPAYDADFLDAAPRLRAIFYAAGSVRYCTPDAFWDRDITISSAFAANAVPVAEYTVAAVLLGMKQFWRRAALARRGEGWGDHTRPIPGAFRKTVGLVSFGIIARRVAQLLKSHDLRVLVYCPFLSETEAAALGVERASLEQLFAQADVVSVHTPLLPATVGLVNGRLVRSMKPDATLINTARGPVLNQPEVIQALRARPDLTAILDVTHPEPPAADDPLFTLPNVVVPPHIAGSHGSECERLGSYMADELQRFVAGQPLYWRITREMAKHMA